MGCDPPRMDQDAVVLGQLQASPTWVLDGSTLTLEGDRGTIELPDATDATHDASLVGPTWRLETILDGETASPVPATVTAFLLFEPGGQVVGSNGCNGFGGPTRATDATLSS